jgi:hypothetical protein
MERECVHSGVANALLSVIFIASFGDDEALRARRG